ncbi:MAG: hypothetical protein WBO24_12500 [Nitrospirales bacterium]
MFKVYAAMHEEMNEGWVWLTGSGFVPRSIIKITNKANKKSVFCECLEIEENFTKKYNHSPRVPIDPNEPTAVINAWYRKRLGNIATKKKYDLQICEANGWWGKFRASAQHPQVVVRLATSLAAISVVLGIFGVGLGALSIYLAFK